VHVTVKLFAGLRERAGWSEREVEAETVGDVWGQLGFGEEPAGLLYAVNQDYAERSKPLSDGDEVAVIPPVSGGGFRLADGPLDLGAVIAEVEDERAGAIATFQGTVRRQSRGRTVIALEYEAYAGMAEKVMAEIADGVKSRYDLCEVAIHHRDKQLGPHGPTVGALHFTTLLSSWSGASWSSG
jgi:MoaE-MoaD fusion protein